MFTSACSSIFIQKSNILISVNIKLTYYSDVFRYDYNMTVSLNITPWFVSSLHLICCSIISKCVFYRVRHEVWYEQGGPALGMGKCHPVFLK